MGQIVSGEGEHFDPKKIEAMIDWPCPKTLKILRGFLGIITYYKKFVHNYGKIVTLLTTLLKKNVFNWNEEVEQDFQDLKDAMSTTQILAPLDFNKIFFLKCGVFGKGIGEILMREGRLLALTDK
jgi:hypothetical protein